VATEPAEPTEPTEPAPKGGGGNRDRLIFLGALAVAGIIALVVVLATGGGDNSSSATGTDQSADTSTKPKVEVPDGAPPTTLKTEDIVVGDGAEAKTGDTVSMQYVGVNYADGKEFDASWDRGQPFTFPLGGGQVIPGWDQGIVGMKVGGRRELIIPPDLGYGSQGQPPTIKPNETLVFVVDLLDVQPAGATPQQ
jgi:peptidylprolyl isomerase